MSSNANDLAKKEKGFSRWEEAGCKASFQKKDWWREKPPIPHRQTIAEAETQ